MSVIAAMLGRRSTGKAMFETGFPIRDCILRKTGVSSRAGKRHPSGALAITARRIRQSGKAEKSGGNDARADAGLAAPLPQDHRSRRDPARNARRRLALGRGADAPHQLPGDSGARPPCREASRCRRLAGDGWHTGLEHRWHIEAGTVCRHRRDHHTSACSREQIAYIANHAEDRCCFSTHSAAGRAACTEIGRVDRRSMRRTAERTGSVAYEESPARTDFAWKEFDEHTAAGFATRPARRATQGRVTRTVRTFSRLSRRPTYGLRRDPFCRSCRCSTPMLGPLSRRRWSALHW